MKFILFTLVAFTLFGLSACKKDEDYLSNLFLQVHPKFGNDIFNYNQEYEIDGRAIVFTKAQVYLTNFSVKTDPVQTNDLVISANPSTSMIDLGKIDFGNSDGINFYIGVDPIRNHEDPSTFPESSVLSNQNDAFRHWSWNTGYQFVVLEGMLDSDQTPDGVVDATFEFHIGSDPFYTLVDLEKNEDIQASQDYTYHMDMDFSRFLDSLDLSDSADYITHTGDNIELANKVKDNFVGVFNLHH